MEIAYVVKGRVTNPESPHYGEVEWQVSDGPPGERTYSDDFLYLGDAIAAHKDKALIYLTK